MTVPGRPPEASRERLLAAHVEAVGYFRQHLLSHPGTRMYLAGRGLPGVAGLDRWALGYAPPGWVGVVGHLRGRGYDDEEITRSGLGVRGRSGRLVDRFRDRVVFPLRDRDGAVVGFTGRALGTDPAAPRYLNSPDTELFHKSSVLFGLTEQRRQVAAGARLLVVEGPLDVLAVDQAQRGRRREAVAVATCGAALTAGHVGLLAAAGSPQVTLAFDPDPAGTRALCRARPLLAGWPSTVHALALPADPADLLRDAGAATARAAFLDRGQPLLDTVIEHRLRPWAPGLAAGWAEASVGALRAVAPLVASDQRPAEVTRRVIALAAALALDPRTVTTEVLRHLQFQATGEGGAQDGTGSRGPTAPSAAE